MVGFLTLFVVTIIISGTIELLHGDSAAGVLGRTTAKDSLGASREKYDLNARFMSASFHGGAVWGSFTVRGTAINVRSGVTSNRPTLASAKHWKDACFLDHPVDKAAVD